MALPNGCAACGEIGGIRLGKKEENTRGAQFDNNKSVTEHRVAIKGPRQFEQLDVPDLVIVDIDAV